MEIPSGLESEAQHVLDTLNQRLLKADPRLEKIAETLSSTTRIAARDREGSLAMRMVPLKSRDLLSRAEIILRNEPDLPWLPLRSQGQGIQSLSVIFLFQAFVEHLLRELYETESKPLLALEEPETHLHPQAVRALWRHVSELPGQKIVTTHSPYFVQHVPFRDLRLVRLTPDGTEVRSLPASFSASIPAFDGLDNIVAKSGVLLTYERATETLTVHGRLDESTYRTLLKCCRRSEDPSEVEQRLRDLRDRSSMYIDDGELQKLDTHARRIRGEIFFAERWLIVEGPTDYLLVHAIAHALDYDLDQYGISVIDAQNNGAPSTFAALARALGIPWLAVFDGDGGGRDLMRAIAKRGFSDEELTKHCHFHLDGDLEAQLVADGLERELQDILASSRSADTSELVGDSLAERLRKEKKSYAAELAARIRQDAEIARRTLQAFQTAIERLKGLR